MKQFYCCDQTFNRYPNDHSNGKTYFLYSRYLEANTEAFYETGPVKASEFPQMAFTIGSVPDEQLSIKTPAEHIKELPIETIKNNGYDLHRLSSRIARGSRRGMGNLILYNSMVLPKIGRPFHLIFCPELEPEEYVIMYRGESSFDGPFFMKEKRGVKYFGCHEEWQDYCIRFKLESNAE